MHALTVSIDIADLQPQAPAESQSEAVQGNEQDAVTAYPGGHKEVLKLLDGDNVRQALRFGRPDQTEFIPGLAQHARAYRRTSDRRHRV